MYIKDLEKLHKNRQHVLKDFCNVKIQLGYAFATIFKKLNKMIIYDGKNR